MVATVEQGHSLTEAMNRLRNAGATDVGVIEFTRFITFKGMAKEAAESIEGIGKAADTVRELVG